MGNRRQEYNHKNIEGTDVSIEISLKEYGFGYSRFDFCEFDNDTDVVKEFNWVDFDDIEEYIGLGKYDWLSCPLPIKIYDLFGYYGYENVFGSTYYEGITYEEIFS